MGGIPSIEKGRGEEAAEVFVLDEGGVAAQINRSFEFMNFLHTLYHF